MMASASLPAWKEFDEALIELIRKSLTQNLCLLFAVAVDDDISST